MSRKLFVNVFVFAIALAVAAGFAISDHRFRFQKPLFLPHLTEVCLGCICEAATNCNLTIGCWRGRCGPFLVTREHWIEAGRPVLTGDHPNNYRSFLACANDPFCSEATVKQYIARYAQDCNGDGQLTCDDYARIHYLGGEQCYFPIENFGYYRVYSLCQASVTWLNG